MISGLGILFLIKLWNNVGIPLKCNQCHSYGHLVSNCHLSLKNNYRDEHKPNFVWRVKKPVLFADFDEVGNVSVQTRDEGFDFSCKESDTSGIASLKPLSFLVVRAIDGIFDEGFMSTPPLRDLGFISPVKTISKTGYFIKSCSKFNENDPVLSSFDVGNGVSGLSSAGPSLKKNEQLHANGALRAVLTLVLVT